MRLRAYFFRRLVDVKVLEVRHSNEIKSTVLAPLVRWTVLEVRHSNEIKSKHLDTTKDIISFRSTSF